MSVDVVVPWRAGCPHREEAWRWVRGRYEADGWSVIEAPAPDGPWCKAAAVTPAVRASGAEVVVVADADVWCDELERAVYAIVCGQADWSMPHGKVHRLDLDGTRAFVAGEKVGKRRAQRPYPGVWGGGIVVLRRETFLDCGLDHRFLDWGQEDVSWSLALSTLHGEGWRGDAPLWHLWHPPEPRLDRQKGSTEGWALYRRYRGARDDPDAMRALLEEGRCLSTA